MKRQKKIVKIIFDEVYRHDLLFVAGCSLDEANKALKKFKIDPLCPAVEPKGMMCRFNKYNSPQIEGEALFMWVKDRKDFYTLYHEVAHLAVEIFDLSNIKIGQDTTEAFAFYQEFWFKKLWRLMDTRKRIIHKTKKTKGAKKAN